MGSTKWFWNGMMKVEGEQKGSYRDFIRAYAACCSFADRSLGRLVSALDAGGHGKNTVIVLWSDHGFHLGEKNHIEKFALWEKANHVPFIIVDPRKAQSAGKTCVHPVDLMTIYPTLLELCGLPANETNDGISVAAQLTDPRRVLSRPALMTYGFNNHAVRTARWRYIRYADGTEELYDHERDPHEWNNLASDPALAQVVNNHAKWLPLNNTKAHGNLK